MQFNPKHWHLVSEIEPVSNIYMLANEPMDMFATGIWLDQIEAWHPAGVTAGLYKTDFMFKPHYAIPLSKMLELVNRAEQEDDLK